MTSINMFQTPVNAGANYPPHRMPTCPPAPRKLPYDPIPLQRLDSLSFPGLPVLPSMSHTDSSSDSDSTVVARRLRPRPTFFLLPNPKIISPMEANDSNEDCNDDNITELPASFIKAFGDGTGLRNEDSDGRQYKRVRRSSLLDGIRHRRPSFAGAA
ncbi:hypothetical protein HJC23_011485 [Cyclotella cryptica]|uniref:Uncharacterized protein n=1 Tax=Cyclotella cryptica TaxID=29204 RepID=A0ABD3PUZ5_9STRA|eukprot:CCRYP_011273-RA/>CCRYP_011273-RA protein AED:0.47 eAED:0.47 QI:0/-1/0/1/-1/1/1/0/156